MKHVQNSAALLLLLLTAGFVTSQFQPIQRVTDVTVTTPGDSATLTVFLLERDLPPTFDRLGTVAIRVNQANRNTHQQLLDELQRVGKQQGANGAYRLQHGTYELDRVGVVSYLLFRYPTK